MYKFIDDPDKAKNDKVFISQDAITEWLLQNRVLSVAFESKLIKYVQIRLWINFD